MFMNKIDKMENIIENQRREIGAFFEQTVQQVSKCTDVVHTVEQVNQLNVNMSNVELSLHVLSSAIEKLNNNTQSSKSTIIPENPSWGARMESESGSFDNLNMNHDRSSHVDTNLLVVLPKKPSGLNIQSCITLNESENSSSTMDECDEETVIDPYILLSRIGRRESSHQVVPQSTQNCTDRRQSLLGKYVSNDSFINSRYYKLCRREELTLKFTMVIKTRTRSSCVTRWPSG